MKIVNGRWVGKFDEPLTQEQHQDFQDVLSRVREFSRGRELSHSKINILFKILDTNNKMDNALEKVLGLSEKEIDRLMPLS
jgi:hypothetical protein